MFSLNKLPIWLGTFVPRWERGETLWVGRVSCLFLRQTAQRFAERDHNRLAGRCGEGQLQVTAVFDFTTELTKLVGNRVHHVAMHIGNEYAGARGAHFRVTQIQELAGDDNVVAAR